MLLDSKSRQAARVINSNTIYPDYDSIINEKTGKLQKHIEKLIEALQFMNIYFDTN